MNSSAAGWSPAVRSPLLEFGGVSFWFFAGVMLLALLLGGGTRPGLGSDAAVQLLGLGLIAACLFSGAAAGNRRYASALVIVAATIGWPLAQLVPLPPSLWTMLPGRTIATQVYEKIGEALPWLPISLDPHATLQSALSLLPAIAVFLATVQLPWRSRRTISLLCLAVGIVSVMLGLAQLMQGPNSALRFYPITNEGDSVGFFANRNHYAALLYCLIPLNVAWLVGLAQDRRPERSFGMIVCVLTYVLLVLGLAMARSRAGILLATFVTVGSLFMARTAAGRLGGRSLAVIASALVLAVVVGGQFGFYGLLARFDDGVVDDFRLSMARITMDAAGQFLPTGSGFGTFVPVYQAFETPNVLLTTYVNHAHNDWLEIWQEGGWPALTIAAAFFIWFILAAGKAWRSAKKRSALDHALASGATLAVAALLLHSGFDYPMRTTAITALFAFCCGLLVDPVTPAPLPYSDRGGGRRLKWLSALENFRERRRSRGWRDDTFG